MICPECQYEYTSQEAINKSVCPACKTFFIDAIIDLANPYNTLNKFRDAIYYLGNECLKDKELLLLLVNGLYQSEIEIQKIFTISINENVNYEMYKLLKLYDRSNDLEAIKLKLISDGFLTESVSKKIIEYWCYVLDYDENEETIRLIEDCNYVNSKGEILFEHRGKDLIFSEGLVYISSENFINYKGEIMIDVKTKIYPKIDESHNNKIIFSGFQNGLSLFSCRGDYGFIDKEGEIVLELKGYESVLSFSEELSAVCINGLWGFIDKKGDVKIKLKYDKVYSFSEGLAPVYANDNWTFIDYNGKIKLSLKEYVRIEPFFNGIAKVKKGKVGFIDKDGNEVISTKYNDAKHFHKENDLIAVKYEKWGVINKKEEVIIPFEFDEIWIITKSLFRVSKTKIVDSDKTTTTHGLYNSYGVMLLEIIYNDIKILDFDTLLLTEKQFEIENQSNFRLNNYTTIKKLYNINQNSIYNLEYKCNEIYPFVNGLAKVTNPRYYGFECVFYIDKCGNIVISIIKEQSNSFTEGGLVGGESFYDGFAAVSNNIQHKKLHYSEVVDEEGETYEFLTGGEAYRLWGIINSQGKLVSNVTFNNINSKVHKNFSATLVNWRKCGNLNKKGRWLYSEEGKIENASINLFYKYDEIGVLSEGLLPVKYNGKWGYTDVDNNIIIPLKYSEVSEFHNGIAKIKEVSGKGEWALINSKGELITSFQYSKIDDYGDELYKVTQYDQENRKLNIGLIDSFGKIQIPIIYEGIKYNKYFNGLYCIKKSGKWGLIDNKLKVIIDFLYDQIGYESNGLVLFLKDDYDANKIEDLGFGLFDRNGKEIAKGFDGLGFMNFRCSNNIYSFCKLNEISKYEEDISNYSWQRYDLDDFWKCNFFNGLSVYLTKIYIYEYEYEYVYRYGFINENGNIITTNRDKADGPILYDDIHRPIYGIFKVEIYDKYGCVNSDGAEIIECKYSIINILSDGFIEAALQGWNNNRFTYKHGLFNWKGEIIIPVEYDELSSFNDGIATGIKNGTTYKIDTSGTIVDEIINTENQ